MPQIEELENKIEELENKIEELENKISSKDMEIDDLTTELAETKRLLKDHRHQGEETSEIVLKYLKGEIKTVSSVPTETPTKRLDEQIIIYRSGVTKRLYIYDFINKIWYYASLT